MNVVKISYLLYLFFATVDKIGGEVIQMKSKTKYQITDRKIKELFENAGIKNPKNIEPLGAGEYNAVFSVTAGEKEYALKIAPLPSFPVLTYEKDMMRSEVFWYETMKEKTEILIPRIFYKDFSRSLIPCDYFIMEKIKGKTLDKAELSELEMKKAREEIVHMLSMLHEIRSDKFGYIQNELYDNWYLALRSIFQNLVSDCERVGKKTKRGMRALKLVDEYKSILETVDGSMINYDLWDVNIIVNKESQKIKLYWIDPERSFFGDPIFDFICLDFILPFSKKIEAKKAYNAFSAEKIKNSREEQIRFAFADLLMGLIQETEKYYRYTPKNYGWWRNVISSAMVYKRGFKVFEK